MTQISYSDEDIVLYLDGAADPETARAIAASAVTDTTLAARIAELDAPLAALTAAFEPQTIGAPPLPAAFAVKAPNTAWRMAGFGAAIAASFAMGAVISPYLQAKPDWVDAVAAYQALYVTETLAGNTMPADTSQQVLTDAAQTFGVDLDAAQSIPGLVFHRAQMLAIDGQPLLQMAYLDADGVPFAFCITRVKDDSVAPRTDMRHALAASSWASDGVGFVLIGGTAPDRVARLSNTLKRQL